MTEAAIDSRIRDAIARGAVVAMSLSGGKDSTAAAFMANAVLDAAGHPRSRRIAVHADLGRAEWRETPATVDAVAAALGLPLIVVRQSRHDLVGRWQDRFERGLTRYAALETLCLIGPWSSAKLRFCTSEAKASVITRFLRSEFAGQEVISVIGIRRAESPARQLTPVSADDRRLSSGAGTSGFIWNPLVDWSTDEVFALHDRAALPLHIAYTRYGSTRLSCAACVLASKHDLEASASCVGSRGTIDVLVPTRAMARRRFRSHHRRAAEDGDRDSERTRGRTPPARSIASAGPALRQGMATAHAHQSRGR
jgi:3'-phosphoadenosine 5'-phosphosulfate sulfotransferase (PAPS reductase)/FAD synthetase